MFSHVPLVPLVQPCPQQLWHPVLLYSLAGHFLCPWRQSPTRVGLGRWESQKALTQIGNKGEAGMRLKFHFGTQPWIQCACLGASRHENQSQRTKDGKRCRPRQANTTAHTPSTSVLPSNFWLQTVHREALGGKIIYFHHAQACLPFIGDWVSSRLSPKSARKWAKVC